MSPLPSTYKHAVFKAQGQPLVIEETPMKMPGKNQVLVKVEACGVCYSDMFAQNNVMGGGFPIVPGHEIIGKIVSLGEGVAEGQWKIGDRVGAGWHGGHDGTCHACKKGLVQMCDNSVVNGETKVGGYGEYTILTSNSIIPIPPHLPANQYAPIMCAGLSCFNAIRQQKDVLNPGDTVAIHGLGGLGHLAVQYAVKMGYRVIVVSRGGGGGGSGDKERFATETLGAHGFLDTSSTSEKEVGERLKEMAGPEGVGLIVSTAPNGDALPSLMKALGPLGKLVILSVPGVVGVDTGVMLRYGLSVQVWPCGGPFDAEDTVRFTELQNVDCMTETFPLDRANDAFESMLSGKARFRAVITMD